MQIFVAKYDPVVCVPNVPTVKVKAVWKSIVLLILAFPPSC